MLCGGAGGGGGAGGLLANPLNWNGLMNFLLRLVYNFTKTFTYMFANNIRFLKSIEFN